MAVFLMKTHYAPTSNEVVETFYNAEARRWGNLATAFKDEADAERTAKEHFGSMIDAQLLATT